MNYAQLSQLVQDTTSNYEPIFVANIPNFVRAAEQRIYNSVQLPASRKNMIGQLSAGNPFLTLPDDWLATHSLAVAVSGVYNFLTVKDVEYIRQAYPNQSILGVPQYYAQFDEDTILLGPTPDASYSVQLLFFHYPPSIVTENTTWLGTNQANVLLYGTLREAYLFMKGEPDLIAEYEKKYNEDLGLLKQLGDGKNRADTFRTPQTRVPVA
jgi:hypothetical protein